MPSIVRFDRPNLSESLAVRLRNMIVDGSLRAGERLNEVRIAAELGVSRTPLREALARLASEGALDSVARIGYFVRPLTLEEFRQIYPIRPLLDPEALRLSGLPSEHRLARLRALNHDLAASRETEQVIGLDDAWHLELIAECPNRVLVDLIRQFMRRTQRYEIALMRTQRNVAVATNDHERIMDALTAGDLTAACAALKQNLESGWEPIESWLRIREASAEAVEGTGLSTPDRHALA